MVDVLDVEVVGVVVEVVDVVDVVVDRRVVVGVGASVVVVVDSVVVVVSSGAVVEEVLEVLDVDEVLLVVVLELVLPRTVCDGGACNSSLRGGTNLPVSTPPTAPRMYRCQMAAGNEPPVTCRPWTLSILRSVPSL